MSKTVVIIHDPFDVDSAECIKDVSSVRGTIKEALGAWPSGARVYDGHVANSHDVTPRVPEDVAALEELQGPVYVVNYPEDPILIIAAIAVVAVAAAVLFLIPVIPGANRQVSSANNELADRQNQPRPKGRIPDIFGQVRSTPDLIALPYKVFVANQELEVAYMCIGRGSFTVEDIRDDTTLVSSIEGASVEVYGPGTSPNSGVAQLTVGSAINKPVLSTKRTTSVNGQVMEPNDWLGPFEVVLRGMTQVVVNVVAPQGMFKDDGDQTSTSVSYSVEVTPVDAAGVATGAAVTQSGTVTGSSTNRDSKGTTTIVALAAPTDRVKVRVQRTTPKDTAFEGSVVDEVKWRDCFGQAPVSQTDFGDVTTVMAQTYATSGALSVKSRKLNMLVTRKLPSRDGEYGFTSELTATRNAADVLCFLALDPYVGRLPGGTIVSEGGLGQVDVPQIYQSVQDVVDYFGIEEAGRFDYTFDQSDLSFQETAQIVATAVFSQAYRRGSVMRLSPEMPQGDSVLLFNHRNKVPGSEARTYSFGTLNNHDGVALTYVDPADDAQVTLYVPQGEDTALNPMKVETPGVRSFEQAYLHAWRHWNRIRYRYLTERFEGLQEADLLVRFDRILSADTTRQGVQDGEVLSQTALVIELSQPVTLEAGETYTCFLQLSTGVVEAIAVTAGEDDRHLVLAAPPSAPLTVSDDAAYRTGYVVIKDGSGEGEATPMLVTEKEATEGFTVGLTAINYDDRYYSNDLDFYTEPSEGGTVPDPGTTVDGTPDPGVSVSISPSSSSTSSGAPSVSRAFTVSVAGGTPTSYFWGVDSGNGYINSGGSAASANLAVFDDSEGTGGAQAQFFCDVVVAGVMYRAYCTMYHFYTGSTFYRNAANQL